MDAFYYLKIICYLRTRFSELMRACPNQRLASKPNRLHRHHRLAPPSLNKYSDYVYSYRRLSVLTKKLKLQPFIRNKVMYNPDIRTIHDYTFMI
jgi:hypothetical protein